NSDYSAYGFKYTLSLPDALPISPIVKHFRTQILHRLQRVSLLRFPCVERQMQRPATPFLRPRPMPFVRQKPLQRHQQKSPKTSRSEEHTSELQSRENLVCRLLLE